MDHTALYAALAFAGLCLIAAAALALSRARIRQELESSRLKLQKMEAEVRHPRVSDGGQRSGKKEKKEAPGELLNLRKEVAKYKRQIHDLKERERQVGTEKRQLVEAHERELYQLRKDKESLMKAIQELEQNLKGASEMSSAKENEEKNLEEEVRELRKNLKTAERKLSFEIEAQQKLIEERKTLKLELKKWTSQADGNEGKPIDPHAFKRWKDRALTARQMYQMMRQLREMSDLKLSTYQDSVVRLAEYILESTGTRRPLIQAGETLSDRYLAAALDALSERQAKSLRNAKASSSEESENTAAHSPQSEQNETEEAVRDLQDVAKEASHHS